MTVKTEYKNSLVNMKKEEADAIPIQGGRQNDQSPEFVFSNLTFSVQKEQKETKLDKRNKFKGRDYKRLLEKATKREEKLTQIRGRNPDKAESIVRNITWERAFRRAAGEKVKDNPELLKKGLKRKEKTKEKRKNEWAKRKYAVKERMEKRQLKRNENIEKREEKRRKRKEAGFKGKNKRRK